MRGVSRSAAFWAVLLCIAPPQFSAHAEAARKSTTDHLNCGVQSVFLALELLGVPQPLHTLAEEFTFHGEFVSLGECERVAELHGLDARAYRLSDPAELLSITDLAILPVRRAPTDLEINHFFLFLGADAATAEILYSTPTHLDRMGLGDMLQHWDGDILLLQPSHKSLRFTPSLFGAALVAIGIAGFAVRRSRPRA
jgi:ABC-type bacteriocin/lantibiotic exporter with double-glycine peptidase domain